MNNADDQKFDDEARRLGAMLPSGPRLAIIGSTHCHHSGTESICRSVGRALAGIDNLMLLTGGVSGVGELVGKSFFAERRGEGHRGVFHILPKGHAAWDYGLTLFAGDNMAERRQILGRLSERYLAIEGGPGTAHEASIALTRSALVLPIGSSGGFAGELYPKLVRPDFVALDLWKSLGDRRSTAEKIAKAVVDIVRLHLRSVQ